MTTPERLSAQPIEQSEWIIQRFGQGDTHIVLPYSRISFEFPYFDMVSDSPEKPLNLGEILTPGTFNHVQITESASYRTAIGLAVRITSNKILIPTVVDRIGKDRDKLAYWYDSDYPLPTSDQPGILDALLKHLEYHVGPDLYNPQSNANYVPPEIAQRFSTDTQVRHFPTGENGTIVAGFDLKGMVVNSRAKTVFTDSMTSDMQLTPIWTPGTVTEFTHSSGTLYRIGVVALFETVNQQVSALYVLDDRSNGKECSTRNIFVQTVPLNAKSYPKMHQLSENNSFAQALEWYFNASIGTDDLFTIE